MQQFRLAQGWRIATFILSPPLIGAACWTIYLSLTGSSFILLPVGIALLALFTYAIIDAAKGKFVIDLEHVSLHGVFGQRTIAAADIQGFRKDENYIHIIPATGRKMSISVYYSGTHEIMDWLSARFPDLDEVSLQDEYDEVAASSEHGVDEAARLRRLDEARAIARYSTWGGWFILAYVALYPRPYELAIGLAIGYPVIMLLLCVLYRGLFRNDEKKGSIYPSLAIPFSVPGMGLVWRAIKDFHILDHTAGWMAIAAIAAGLYLMYMAATQGFRMKGVSNYLFALLFPLVTAAYAYGTVTVLNCMVDPGQPAVHKAVVGAKKITKGKSTTYYLVLQPWAGWPSTEEVSVPPDMYERTRTGDAVLVFQRNGAFEMPWIKVDFNN